MATDINPLNDLKDIYLPQPVSLWPLASGWYIVIILLLVAAILLSMFGVKKYRKISKRKKIIQLFNSLENNYLSHQGSEVLSKISVLLKQVAITQFPNKNPQHLHGEKWLLFLDETGKTNKFSNGAGGLLIDSYKPQVNDNLSDLFPVIRLWLRRVL